MALSEADRSTVTRETNIVFHVAATVRFEEKLSKSTTLAGLVIGASFTDSAIITAMCNTNTNPSPSPRKSTSSCYG